MGCKGLVTNNGGGGLQNGKGGHVKFYPYGKGAWKKFKLNRGHNRFWGNF